MSQSKNNKEQAPGQNKTLTVYVNGRKREVEKRELSFNEVVGLAYDDSDRGPQIVFTVTFKRGEGEKSQGTLVEGDSVQIKKDMVFNVTRTDKS